jgi:hypothetical protein
MGEFNHFMSTMEPRPAFEEVYCPFCKERDFDLVGLKIHLTNGHCEEFNSLSVSLPVTRRISPDTKDAKETHTPDSMSLREEPPLDR